MLFEGNDYDIDLTFFDIPGSNFKEMQRVGNLFSVKEGFMRGNMFRNEYLPYKNLTYLPLNPRNERERKLFDIMGLTHAITDLNLYLDLHPEDMEAYNLFRKYVKEAEVLKDEFSKTFGPLKVDQIVGNKYVWEENPWPWDKEGGTKYV